MLRSILSILTGLAVMTAATFAIEFAVDAILLRTFPAAFPSKASLSASKAVLLLMIAYTLACMSLGGYVTALVAHRWEVRHAIALAVLQEILTVIAMIEKLAPAPTWVWFANLTLVPVAIILGGYWKERQRARLAGGGLSQ